MSIIILGLAGWLWLATLALAQESIVGTLQPFGYDRVDMVFDDSETHTVSGTELLDKVTVVVNGSHVIGQSLASHSDHDANYDSLFEVEGGKLTLEGSRAGAIIVNNGQVELKDTLIRDYSFEIHADHAVQALGDSLVQIADGSVVEMLDDGALSILADDNARVEVTGGTTGYGLYDGNSQLLLSDGELSSVRLRNSAHFEMTGGRMTGSSTSTSYAVTFDGDSQVAIHGGDISLGGFRANAFVGLVRGHLMLGAPNVTLSTPEPSTLLMLSGQSSAHIAGGSYQLTADGSYLARLSNAASLRVTGGTFPAGLLADVQDGADLIVAGTDFNYPLGTITDLEGELTGILADGSAFSWNFVRGESATILLVPEPSTAFLIAFASPLLVFTTRRTRT